MKKFFLALVAFASLSAMAQTSLPCEVVAGIADSRGESCIVDSDHPYSILIYNLQESRMLRRKCFRSMAEAKVALKKYKSRGICE